MTEKRYLLKYLPYECSNGEMIETDPYYVDTKQEYVDTDDFRIEGMLTMSDKQILELLNENEELKQDYETLKLQDDSRKLYQRTLEDENRKLKQENHRLNSKIKSQMEELAICYEKLGW